MPSYESAQDSRKYSIILTLTPGAGNPATNQTPVTWKLQLVSRTYAFAKYACTGNVTLNGTTVWSIAGESRSYTPYGNTFDVASGTTNIPHNSDGTKTFSFSAAFKTDVSSTYGTTANLTVSGSLALATIPRTSVVTLSASSIGLGSSLTITTNRASSSFTHVAYYAIGGGSWNTISSGIGASYAWTVPASIASSIPSSTSTSVTVYLETYSGATYIGTSSKSFTATVPNNATFQPSAPTLTLAATDTKGSLAVKGISKINVKSSSSGKYGASISSYTVTIAGSSYTGSNITSGVINSTGNVSVSVVAKDSRGYSSAAGTGSVAFVDNANSASLSASSGNLGTTITLTHTLKTSQTRSVTVPFGTFSGTTWTLPSNAAGFTATSLSRSGTITVKTLHSGTEIASQNLSFTLNIPDNDTFRPNITTSTVVPVQPAGINVALNSYYIQGVTKVKANINGAVASASNQSTGASISEFRKTILGSYYYGSGEHTSSDAVSTTGTNTVSYRLTDSRGLQKTTTQTFQVQAYNNPVVSKFTAERVTGDLQKVKIVYSYSAASINSANRVNFKVEYRQVGESTWTTIADTGFSGTGASITATDVAATTSSNLFNPDYAYHVRFTATDYVGREATYIATVDTEFVLMHFRSTGKGIGIGQISTKDALEINIPVEVSSVMKQEGYNVLDERYNPSMSVAWGDITGKPSTFAPSSHTHTQLDIVDVRTYNSGGAEAYSRTPAQVPDRQLTTDFAYFSGAGSSWRSSITMRGWYGSGYAAWQLIGCANTPDDDLYLRTGEGSSWRTARLLYHSGNKPYIAQSRWGSAPSNPVAGDMYFTA